jgi:hypothetical protein
MRDQNADQMVGTPMCPDCYDYDGAVLYNALAPELWRRTSIYIARYLARTLGPAVWPRSGERSLG